MICCFFQHFHSISVAFRPHLSTSAQPQGDHGLHETLGMSSSAWAWVKTWSLRLRPQNNWQFHGNFMAISRIVIQYWRCFGRFCPYDPPRRHHSHGWKIHYDLAPWSRGRPNVVLCDADSSATPLEELLRNRGTSSENTLSWKHCHWSSLIYIYMYVYMFYIYIYICMLYIYIYIYIYMLYILYIYVIYIYI